MTLADLDAHRFGLVAPYRRLRTFLGGSIMLLA